MFDTKKIGSRIAELRKAKDMTQMELADQMLVSFQAVSNWERGNTMPDISKLADLARILGISIEDLLDSEEQSRIVEKVVRKDPDIKLEEVVEIAPILKPSELEQAAENSPQQSISLDELTSLAPFLSSARLTKEIEKARIEDLSDLVRFAPFLDSEFLGSFIEKQPGRKRNLKALIALAPFLESRQLAAYAEQAMEGEDFKRLSYLAPFMDKKDLEPLVLKLFDSGIPARKLSRLAPFISAETLADLIARVPFEEQGKYLKALAPFMKSKHLNELARVQMQKGNMKIFRDLLPFIDEDELL